MANKLRLVQHKTAVIYEDVMNNACNMMTLWLVQHKTAVIYEDVMNNAYNMTL